MKKTLYMLFFIPLLAVGQNKKAEPAFTLQEKDLIPEGIAYNPADKSFYVGSINKKKIVKIDSRGSVSDFVKAGADGLAMVIGLRIDPELQQLWVCSNEGEGIKGGQASVNHYDLRSGKLIHRYVVQVENETHFFNDIVIAHGKLYITDSEFRAVYELDPATRTIALFLKSDRLYYPNGIVWIEATDNLVVSSGTGLITVNLATRYVGSIPFGSYFLFGSDGMYYYEGSIVAIQNVSFPITINRFYLNDQHTAITKGEVLLIDEPNFDMPTTGAIADGWFYFIANSQLRNYEKGVIKEPAKLKEISIMRIRLK